MEPETSLPTYVWAKLGNTCKEMIASNAGMSYPYLQQIGDINLARQWKQIEVPVLVIYRYIRPSDQRGRKPVFGGHHQQLSSRKRHLPRDRRDGSRIWPLRLSAGIPRGGWQHLQAPSV